MSLLSRRSLFRAASSLASLWAAGRPGAALAATAARPLQRDPKRLIDLPPGFSYRILARRGDRMSDGYRVPGNPDAMGVFRGSGGSLILMCNHEVTPGDRANGPYPPGKATPPQSYDPNGFGGVTRLVFDPETLALRSSNLALCGTHWNCAGGLSPWGWLSCEEIFLPEHGYVFLVPSDVPQLTAARRIRGYGHFRHEAATVDPRTQIAYLTEDREDAAFYRFLPARPDTPFEGTLQALRVKGEANFDTNRMGAGESLEVDWVDVPLPDSPRDDVRLQAQAAGAARFVRTEGLWLGDGELYFTATAGGPIGRGQIFRLRLGAAAERPRPIMTADAERPRPITTADAERPRPITTADAEALDRLTLLVQTSDTSVLDMPDNLTVSPHGLLFLAEDGYEGNYLRCVTPSGEVFDFARNARTTSEFAGPCFSPDGRTLFVNLQRDGLTLAIRGPFDGELHAANLHGQTPDDLPTPPGVAGLGTGALVLALAALSRRRKQRQP
jgi:uncharacterized protein